MAYNKRLLFLGVLFYCNVFVSGQQSSLTFVIDDTPSMRNDIASVRVGATQIYRTVIQNKDVSQIDNFVLVTFNDHSITEQCPFRTILHAKTKDEATLFAALNGIRVDKGTRGCAECAMGGVKRGLEESLPKSNLYIFTDATAKDFYMYEQVKKLALTKQCQIVFVLSGFCGEPPTSPSYRVYVDLAEATGGNVFHIDKQSINSVLDYVKLTIAGTMTKEVKPVRPGNNNITVNTDPLMGEILFSLSSRTNNPSSVSITGPDGNDVWKRVIFETGQSKAYAFNATKPGPHTVQVTSTTEAQAVVSAQSGVDYDYGFSAIKLKSLLDSSTLPVPGAKTHLLVNLNKGNIELRSIQILDADGKVQQTLPLELLNDSNFYTTKDFTPPTTPFRIAIVGVHPESGATVIRPSPTTIEPAKILPGETITNKPPKVTIESGDKVSVNYDERLSLICKVEAYPAPTIEWKKGNNVVSNQVVPGKNFPYDHISELVVEKVTEGTTYTCEAKNTISADTKQIVVTVNSAPATITNKNNANTIAVTGDLAVKIVCNVNGAPKPTITWTKDGSAINLGPNYSVENGNLIIKNVPKAAQGFYRCNAKNPQGEDKADFQLVVREYPTYTPATSTISVKVGETREIECPLPRGPADQLRWFLNEEFFKDGKLVLNRASRRDSGFYSCRVVTPERASTSSVEVFVGFQPKFTKDQNENVDTSGPSSVFNFNCETHAVPRGIVTWTHEGNKLDFKGPIYSFKKGTSRPGVYNCEVQNKFGKITRKFIASP